jgi:hypothetical protein
MHYATVFVLGLNYLGTKIKWKKKEKNFSLFSTAKKMKLTTYLRFWNNINSVHFLNNLTKNSFLIDVDIQKL